MGMGGHHEVQPANPHRGQLDRDLLGVGASVDEDGGPARRSHQRAVALSHVEELTVSEPGGPARTALDQTNRGKTAAASTTIRRDTRPPERTHRAAAHTAAIPPRRTPSRPPPEVIAGSGARANRAATHARYGKGRRAAAA